MTTVIVLQSRDGVIGLFSSLQNVAAFKLHTLKVSEATEPDYLYQAQRQFVDDWTVEEMVVDADVPQQPAIEAMMELLRVH